MNRLHSAWQRLFFNATATSPDPLAAPPLLDADGRCRALLLELARPADWQLLGAVWRGVQTELGLPAPAIAVNGEDGFQLWFSLAEPVAAAEGQVLLQALCRRFLPAELAPGRLRLWPSADKAQAPRLPPFELKTGGECWAAFVAPDLAPVFADSPWLDVPPGDEGQADLLARLQPLGAEPLRQAREALLASPAAAASEPPASAPTSSAAAASTWSEPRAFLLAVMNDASQPMQLRIEAAKALLPFSSAAG
ncbi:hypothetical protein RQP53_14170 [Paucibacter sp. APW11]|uniref:DUF4123 domain-containing protein n=1 Tax=Roseateles aquae TaxID=3077235 RepID=A0ABU3PDP8_9BURK|nr:hypothetical protein [Paucibacter sp. APW11]MDT9000417.1 hypothetical protein [Paucibacter sp. APW11]